jgi:wyosine [tRNA(Phe)-imidazoG37] synthetase (radical SAM superfamily)
MGQVHGPLLSSLFGRCLCIDLTPPGTCTYECIHCEQVRIDRKTTTREEWFPLDSLVSEFTGKLRGRLDTVLIRGSGEPTLHSRMGELIESFRNASGKPVAVCTNGSLLRDESVRRELREADIVLWMISSGTPAMFQEVNRPHHDIRFEDVLEGVDSFRTRYRGGFWAEAFILNRHTATIWEAKKMAKIVNRLRPERVVLNSMATRCRGWAARTSPSRLRTLSKLFAPKGEVIAEPDYNAVA